MTVLLVIVLFQNTNLFVNTLSSNYVHSLGTGYTVLIAVGGPSGPVLILGLISHLSWRVARFAVTDSGVHYRSGILLRALKRVRLEHTQGVDTQRSLLGRVLGLSMIDIEVTGEAGLRVAFGFLKIQELEDLRAEILARASGVFFDTTVAQAGSSAPHHSKASVLVPGTNASYGEGTPLLPVGTSSPSTTAGMTPRRSAPSTPEQALYRMPSGRLLSSLILTGGVFVGILILFVVFAGVDVLTTLIGTGGLSGAVGLPSILLTMGVIIWKRFTSEFNFTGAVSPGGIRTRSGLPETRSQTIPPN